MGIYSVYFWASSFKLLNNLCFNSENWHPKYRHKFTNDTSAYENWDHKILPVTQFNAKLITSWDLSETSLDNFNCLAWLTEPRTRKQSPVLELFKALTEDHPYQDALHTSVLLWASPKSFFIISILVRSPGHWQYNVTLCYLSFPQPQMQVRPFLAAANSDDEASLTQHNTSATQKLWGK